MYKLEDFLSGVIGIAQEDLSSKQLYCSENDTEKTFLTNQMQEALAGYSYTLVKRGWLELIYNGQEITLQPGDLYIYSPGFQVTVVSGSEDYHSICLIADEMMALESSVFRNMIHTAYYPLAELGMPVVRLKAEEEIHFWKRMKEIEDYLHSSHRFLNECLYSLYSVFLLDLMNVMEQYIGHHSQSERTADLFVSFMRLLPKNFIEHHDIGFYASDLCITTTHLSRVVRQMSGRTVMDYINHLLLMEALWLLKSSNMSIAAIAERLRFADQASFSKFFIRMKGIGPKAYRSRIS